VDINKDTMTDDYNAVYWDKRYTLRTSQIPLFIAHQADVILTTGKYLNAIRQCGLIIVCPHAGVIPFKNTEREYDRILLQAYRYAAAALLDHLMNDVKLLDRLACLKNYFLLQVCSLW
jgi:gamma-tubulin complex component 2